MYSYGVCGSPTHPPMRGRESNPVSHPTTVPVAELTTRAAAPRVQGKLGIHRDSLHVFPVALTREPPPNNVRLGSFLQTLRQLWADNEFHDAALD